jgi:hypothetical protein
MVTTNARYLVRPMRLRGRALSDQEFAAQPLLPCTISIAQMIDDDGMVVRVASCRSLHSEVSQHLLPDLWAPELATLTDQGLSLEGYEKCVEGGQVRHAQTWHILFGGR